MSILFHLNNQYKEVMALLVCQLESVKYWLTTPSLWLGKFE